MDSSDYRRQKLRQSCPVGSRRDFCGDRWGANREGVRNDKEEGRRDW